MAGPGSLLVTAVEKRQRGNARTMVASVIAGINGSGGVMGVLPGVSLVNYGVNASGGFTCGDAVAATAAMIRVKVPVLNMSVGSAAFCASLYRVVEQGIGTGMTVVAAAGNEFAEGNPVEYPAAFPHVLSVAALSLDGSSSYFSNENAAVDLSAPGEQVPVAIPAVFDVDDGVQDGVTLEDGNELLIAHGGRGGRLDPSSRPGVVDTNPCLCSPTREMRASQ